MAEEHEKPKCKQCRLAEKKIKDFWEDKFFYTIGSSILITVGMFIIGFCLYTIDTPDQAPEFVFTLGILLILSGTSLFFIFGIPNWIIGKYVYYFKDKDGTIHSHKQKHVWMEDIEANCWKTPPQNIAEWNAKDFLVDGPIVGVKYGGWFKKPFVSGYHGEYYEVHATKNKLFDLHAFHYVGAKRYASVIKNIDMLTAIKLIEKFEPGQDIFRTALSHKSQVEMLNERIEQQHETLRRTSIELGIASNQRTFLGREMLKRLIQIHRNKAMGKSKHARDLRQSIEETIKELPREIVEKWAEQLEGGQEIVYALLNKFDQEKEDNDNEMQKAANG